MQEATVRKLSSLFGNSKLKGTGSSLWQVGDHNIKKQGLRTLVSQGEISAFNHLRAAKLGFTSRNQGHLGILHLSTDHTSAEYLPWIKNTKANQASWEVQK